MYGKAMWEHPSPFKLIRNNLISQVNVLNVLGLNVGSSCNSLQRISIVICSFGGPDVVREWWLWLI